MNINPGSKAISSHSRHHAPEVALFANPSASARKGPLNVAHSHIATGVNTFKQTAPMSNAVFLQFKRFIEREVGLRMPQQQKTMLEIRLQQRLRLLGMESFDDYCRYVFSPHGQPREVDRMIDVVTTHTTEFFRQAEHFSYLSEEALPEILRKRGSKKIRLWSAGCSTGEEAYTLAIVLREYCEGIGRDVKYGILATDVSKKVVKSAKDGIYSDDKIAPVPVSLRKKYFLRGKKTYQGTVRLLPEIREKVVFRTQNLQNASYHVRKPRDIIFCRNVLIYFEMPMRKTVLQGLCDRLRPGGYLFLGASEAIEFMGVALERVAPYVYKKPVS